MSDNPPPASTYSLLAARIVGRYLRHHRVPPDQLPALIVIVNDALAQVGKAVEAVAERSPAVPIRRSVQHDLVVCLDCGWRGQVLRGHVATAHGLTAEEYRQRWKLPADHPLIAPAYSERRSIIAKQLGLGRGLHGSVTVAEKPEPEAPKPVASSRRRGRTRKAS